VYVSIGSNIDREHNVRGAVRELTARYGPLTLSPVYESRAVGFAAENFYNLVAGFDTGEPIEDIKETLARIESQYGRARGENRFSARTLDLDLLLYDAVILDRPNLQVPHPRMHERRFVLAPLYDLAADAWIPGRGAVADLLAQCPAQRIERMR
jgi:2-amino-4-hydroxy-6-hydroxymethyldihydropteridine diphosphokinase